MKRIGVYGAGLALVCCGLAVLRGQRNDRSPEKWVAQANMHSPRAGACSALLQDGRVLITGGTNASRVLPTAEVFGGDEDENRRSDGGENQGEERRTDNVAGRIAVVARQIVCHIAARCTLNAQVQQGGIGRQLKS